MRNVSLKDVELFFIAGDVIIFTQNEFSFMKVIYHVQDCQSIVSRIDQVLKGTINYIHTDLQSTSEDANIRDINIFHDSYLISDCFFY